MKKRKDSTPEVKRWRWRLKVKGGGDQSPLNPRGEVKCVAYMGGTVPCSIWSPRQASHMAQRCPSAGSPLPSTEPTDQRIWIINRNPRLTFCRRKLLQILRFSLPVYCPPPLPPTTADLPTPDSCFPSPPDIHRERIWSSFGGQKVERGLLLLINILCYWPSLKAPINHV